MSAQHPLFEAVASVRTALAGVMNVQPVFLDPSSKAELVRQLAAAGAQLAELELRVLACCGDAAAEAGARDVGAWLAATVPMEGRTARASARLAAAVESWPQVHEAMAHGHVTVEQARVITAALEQVAPMLASEQRASAETLLITEAKDLDPARLRILGTRLASLVGAEDGKGAEAALLAAEEAAVDRHARLTISRRGDGMTRVHGLVPDAVGHRLTTCLEAFAQPRRMAYEADGKPIPYPKLMADALRDLLERLDPGMLPAHGGDATTVFVTMSVAELRDEVATTSLGLGAETVPLTAAQARRLACEAAIIPVVLGGDSEILDVGRRSRLHTPVMRKALRLRDQHCRAEGCEVPAAWCQAHHLDPWATGGETSLRSGILLCAHHHHRAHDPDYDHTRLPSGDLRFHRRT